MDQAIRALLACPACGSELAATWRCDGCGESYGAPGGIPALRRGSDRQTETVRAFYTQAPFPGYPPNPDRAWLHRRAEHSRFARLLGDAIPPNATVAEIGCGTGQVSLYLALTGRTVIGADLTRASLELAAAAAESMNIGNVHFVETDLLRSGLRPAAFDVVYCSGVLHHTPDPERSFAEVAKLAKPGGLIIVGLYNAFARMPLRMRRGLWKLFGGRGLPHDAVLRERDADPLRREAWLRDQYCHPLERCHTLGEVRRWCARCDVEYLRAYPSALLGEEEAGLLEPQPDGWWAEEWLAQLGWIRALAGEGGLFVTVGRRRTG